MPTNRAEEKLRQLGLAPSIGAQDKNKRVTGAPTSPRGKQRATFRLYFPRPPYNGTLYHAAFSNGLFNFVGLVLGHHGTTIQRIQRESGARVEIHDKDGNLNGDYPSAADPSLHAFISAENKESLDKAVDLLLDVLAPMNTDFEPIKVTSGGGAFLEANALPTHRPSVQIKHVPAPASAASNKPNTNASKPAADGSASAGNVWSGKQANPAVQAANQDSNSIPAKPELASEVRDITLDSKRGSCDMDSHVTSYGMDSLHSLASTVSEDVNTPTSAQDLFSNGSLLSFSSGMSCVTGMGPSDASHHNNNQVGVVEFPSWNPFASSGLFEELHQIVTPGRNGDTINLPKPGAMPAPFPGVGSWSHGQVREGMPAVGPSPLGNVAFAQQGLQGLY